MAYFLFEMKRVIALRKFLQFERITFYKKYSIEGYATCFKVLEMALSQLLHFFKWFAFQVFFFFKPY